MFRYVVTVEQSDGTFVQDVLSRLTTLGKGGNDAILRRYGRKFPEAVRIEVEPIEETAYQQRKALHNRHED